MKTMKYLLMLMSIVSTMLVSAQSLSVADQRYMNMDVLRFLEEYEYNASVYNDRQQKTFVQLFEDPSLLIYNDLLGLSGATILSVSEYANILRTKGVTPAVVVKNLNHGVPYEEGDRWLMPVTFDKSIEYTNVCGTLFSSEEYYRADHKLKGLVAWDPQQRTCRFVELSGSIDSDITPLPDEYYIFTKTSPRDELLLCDGERIKYNYFGQAFLDINSKFTYPYDSDVYIKLINEDETCNMVSMSYVPKRWRFKPHYDMSYGNCYIVDGAINGWNTTSKTQTFGADLGYIFPSKSNTKWGLFFGAAWRNTNVISTISNLSYKYNSSADVDGDSYIRNYKLRDVKYHTTISELGIPLYWNIDKRFNQRLSMYFDFGAKVYLELFEPKTSFDAVYTTSGTYKQYGNITFDANSFYGYVLNGFVEDEVIHRDNVYNYVSENPIEYSVDVFAGLGFRMRVFNDLYIDLGYSYQMNMLDSHQWEKTINTKDTKESNKPITYSIDKIVNGKAEGTENVKSVTSFYSFVERYAYQLNMGIMFRF